MSYRWLSILLGATTAVLAVTCGVLWHALETERERSGLRHVHHCARSESVANPTAMMTGAHDAAPPSTVPTIGSSTASGVDFGQANRDALQDDPVFRAAVHRYHRLSYEKLFASLGNTLRLPPSKLELVLDLLVQQELLASVKSRPAADASYAQRRKQRDESRREVDTALRSLLTESEINTFRRYQDSLASREQVNELRNELMAGSEPLRDDQIEPLVAVIHAEQSKLLIDTEDLHDAVDFSSAGNDASIRKYQHDFLELETAAVDRTLAAAKSILYQGQIKAFERQLRRQLDISKAGAEVQNAQRAALRSLADPAATTN
jgi:hypothetical protein